MNNSLVIGIKVNQDITPDIGIKETQAATSPLREQDKNEFAGDLESPAQLINSPEINEF